MYDGHFIPIRYIKYRLNAEKCQENGVEHGYLNKNSEIYELKYLLKEDLNTRQDKWWMDDVLNVYSKKANIRQLRRESYIRSPETLKDFQSIVDETNPKWYPWIPGSSFMTDGFQIKLPLISVRHNRTPGLNRLFEKGFTGFKSKSEEIEHIDISTCKNGIYVLGKQDLYMKPECLSQTIFAGFDPGRNKPISACVIDGSDIPMDWSDEARIYTVDKAVDRNYFIENKEYRLATGSIQQEKYEEKRRKKIDYKKALEMFNRTNCKSGLVNVNEGYYRARLTAWSSIRQEKYHRSRLCYRFISFKTRQLQIARFAKQLISRAVCQSKEKNKKLILLFGDGSFRPGGSGYAAVPRKPFIRELETIIRLNKNLETRVVFKTCLFKCISFIDCPRVTEFCLHVIPLSSFK